MDNTYFQNEIAMGLMFGQKLDMPNAQNAKEWAERIENDLSPENLTCDGELRGAAVMKKRMFLNQALQYVQQFLPQEAYQKAYQTALIARRQVRDVRTAQRQAKLQAAVQNGFHVGTRILISNGLAGTIVKVNRTRVKVKSDDGRMWSVPPAHMQRLQVK